MLKIYSVYPNNIIYNEKLSSFQNLKLHIEFLYKMGFNAIHILPFFKSPQIDRGFDIEDYMEIDSIHGTLDDFKDVLKEAKKYSIEVYVDLIMNHASQETSWFKYAKENNERYINYFIHSKEEPKFLLEKSTKDNAVFIYNDNEINIEIPSSMQDINFPFWTKINDIWYYHSFYPSQIDLNWDNKEVFKEFKKIIEYWSSFELNFRLDAVSLIGSCPYKNVNEFNKLNFKILKKLKEYCLKLNPKCKWISESTQHLKILNFYFKHNIFDYAYNFKLNSELWNTFLTGNKLYFEQEFIQQKKYPEIKWLSYIRNHDELIYSKKDLISHKFNCSNITYPNLEFNIGKSGGIVGTTFSLCCDNIKKFLLLYFFLISSSKNIMMFSGDEIAKSNIKLITKDTREICRGPIKNVKNNSKEIKDIHLEKNKIPEFLTTMMSFTGNWDLSSIETPEYIMVFILEEKNFVSIINIGNEAFNMNLNILDVLYTYGDVKYNNNELKINGYSAIIFKGNC